MKVGQIGPTFRVPGKTVNFLGVKTVVPFSTLKMRKSHKKLARVYAYTHVYTQIRDGIVGKKRDPGILDPELFSGQIRKVEARLGKLAKIRKVETD